MFNALSLARRLSLGFLCVLVLLVGVALSSAYALSLMGQSIQKIVQVDNLKTRLANDLMASVRELAVQSRSVVLFTDMDAKALALEMQSAKAAMVSFGKTEKELSSLVAQGRGTAQEAALMVEISLAAKKVFPEVDSVLVQAQDGDTVAAVLSLMNRVRPAELVLSSKTKELIELQRSQTEAASVRADQLKREAFFIETALVVFA